MHTMIIYHESNANEKLYIYRNDLEKNTSYICTIASKMLENIFSIY
jgi:hypothetical protein